MKKIILKITLFMLMFGWISNITNAATCDLWTAGWINGAWTVPGDCTFPTWPHMINWDVTVWDRVVTIPDNSMLVIDLSLQKITFNLWKILLQGNAVIKYIWSSAFTSTSWITSCASGTAVNPTSLANAPADVTSNNAPSSGRFYCQ